MSHSQDDDGLLDEVAHWMAVLASGQVSAQEQLAFRRWRDADPRRAEIFQRMNARLSTLEHERLRRIPRDSLLQSLTPAASRRRVVTTSLGLLGMLAGGTLLWRATALGTPAGLLHTATGERLSTVLADGSQLTLAPRTQVLPQFVGAQPVVQLQSGQLLVEVAGSQPLIVATAQGRTEVFGQRLLVRKEAGQTQITTFAGEAEIITLNGARQRLHAGQQARFNRADILSVQVAQGNAAAWTQGLLEVRDQSLGEVVAALRDYRPGVLRITPEAAQLRLSGIFPLDDSSRALQLLAKSLPVRITYRSAYWVSIELS